MSFAQNARARYNTGVLVSRVCQHSFVSHMSIIDDIKAKFASDAFEFSEHAVNQTILRQISVQEIREAIQSGDVIEDYPNDKYGPSVLILGFTGARRPLHIQCTYPSRPLIKIVTVYEPDEKRWIDYRIRRAG